VGVGAMGASNGVKESSGVNGSGGGGGGHPPSERELGEVRMEEGRVVRVREDRVRAWARQGLVMRARVRRGRRVWAVMRRRRQSGGGGRWVGGGFSLSFFFVDQIPAGPRMRVDWYTPRWCAVFLPWLCLLTCKQLD
jgi:hypothetical protein